MKLINHDELRNYLKVCYDTKTPSFVWGTMGIGKSSIVKQVAQDIAKGLSCDFKEGEVNGKDTFCFIDVRISQLEPSDLRGLPNIDQNNNTTKWIIPNWLPRNEESKGILFFDEINLAPPSIQASAYQLINDRRLGDYKLPSGWVIVSAGNTIEDKANVYELPAPLSNRFTHVKLNIPSMEIWRNWGLRNGIEPSLIAFLEFKPSFLFKFDGKNKEKAFPTPRSLEFCSNLIKGRKLTNHEKEILIASAVGEGFAMEFIAFTKLQAKINIKDLLQNPHKVKEIKEIDLKYSLLSALTEIYNQNKKELENLFKICEYLEAEFSILLLRFLVSSDSGFKNRALKSKLWGGLSSKYGKYLINLKND